MICGDEHNIGEVLFLNPYICKTLLVLLFSSRLCGVSFCHLRGNSLLTFEARHLGYLYKVPLFFLLGVAVPCCRKDGDSGRQEKVDPSLQGIKE